MKSRIFLGLLLVGLLVVITGCGSLFVNGTDETFDVNVEKDKAKELDLELNIGAGELNVAGGAKEWVEGTIEYNHEQLKPEVAYQLDGKKGKAVIEQNNDGIGRLKEIENKWDLTLNDEVPYDLQVNTGASETELHLSGIQLSGLDVNAGVGDVTIDLRGEWKKGFDASLEMGVGHSTIILPKDVGVKIISTKGIGDTDFVGFISKGNGVYVNEAYEDADVIINIKTEMGVGETSFKLEK